MAARRYTGQGFDHLNLWTKPAYTEVLCHAEAEGSGIVMETAHVQLLYYRPAE
jgi:hypothetical protein